MGGQSRAHEWKIGNCLLTDSRPPPEAIGAVMQVALDPSSFSTGYTALVFPSKGKFLYFPRNTVLGYSRWGKTSRNNRKNKYDTRTIELYFRACAYYLHYNMRMSRTGEGSRLLRRLHLLSLAWPDARLASACVKQVYLLFRYQSLGNPQQED